LTWAQTAVAVLNYLSSYGISLTAASSPPAAASSLSQFPLHWLNLKLHLLSHTPQQPPEIKIHKEEGEFKTFNSTETDALLKLFILLEQFLKSFGIGHFAPLYLRPFAVGSAPPQVASTPPPRTASAKKFSTPRQVVYAEPQPTADAPASYTHTPPAEP